MNKYRQGDLALLEVNDAPAIAKTTNRTILLRGEKTGHNHRVVGDAQVLEADGKTFVKTGDKGASIKHEEHAPIDLPGNTTVEVKTQREYQPKAAPRPRAVAD